MGLLAAACSSSPTSPSESASALSAVTGTVSGRTITVVVDAASPLASVGGAATLSTSLGRFLLARTSDSAITALTAVCTHQGCLITGFANTRFVCNCHGSQFTTGGAVTNGPATAALQSYPTTFANGEVRFDV